MNYLKRLAKGNEFFFSHGPLNSTEQVVKILNRWESRLVSMYIIYDILYIYIHIA